MARRISASRALTDTEFHTDTQTKELTGTRAHPGMRAICSGSADFSEERFRCQHLNFSPFTRQDRPYVFVAQQIREALALVFLLERPLKTGAKWTPIRSSSGSMPIQQSLENCWPCETTKKPFSKSVSPPHLQRNDWIEC